MKKKLEAAKASLAKRKAALPYELLGRSLAASAFFPRDFESLFNPAQPGLIKIIKDPSTLLTPSVFLKKDEFAKWDPAERGEGLGGAARGTGCALAGGKGGGKDGGSVRNGAGEGLGGREAAGQGGGEGGWVEGVARGQAPAAYLLDTSQAQPEGLSLIRRYSQALIIQDDLFIDEYQLLEALVFGADCVILREELLGWAGLKKFLSAAAHFGLAAAVKISGRAGLARAILAGARILLLSPPEDSSPDFLARLIPQIPAGKFLIAPATFEGVGAVILE